MWSTGDRIDLTYLSTSASTASATGWHVTGHTGFVPANLLRVRGSIITGNGAGNVEVSAPTADDLAWLSSASASAGGVWKSALSGIRGYLSGLTMSTAGSSTTMTIAAGQAADSTNSVLMSLAAAIGKTTSAWAVGSGNGGLDTGAIGASTWYHFFLIMRPDTGVVDVLFSTSASSPSMPANYTYKRRIGAGKTDGSSNWTLFVQDGDTFQWAVPTNSINTSNPGTAAVSATLNMPPSLQVRAWIGAELANGSNNNVVLYISDPAVTDSVPDNTAFFTVIGGAAAATTIASCDTWVRTNTSAQVRYRINFSGASDIVRITSKGWIDRRGRDD